MKTLNAIRMVAVLGGAGRCDGKPARALLDLIIRNGPGPFNPHGARYALAYLLCGS